MLHWLLTQMETQLSASFAGAFLRSRFKKEFENLIRASAIQSLAQAPDYTVDGDGKRRLVVYEGDTAVLIDENDPEAEHVSVPVVDVIEWQVNLDTVIAGLRAANGVVGNHGALTERLWLFGQADSTAHIFALLSSVEMARAHVTALPNVVAGAPTRFYVACPSFRPPPPLRREFEEKAIYFVTVDGQLTMRGTPTRQTRAVSRGGGRPAGRSAGAMLDCWLMCHGLLTRHGSERAAYNAIHEYFLDEVHQPAVPLPTRAEYSHSRSYARTARGVQPCQWYLHRSEPPSQLLSQ